MSNCYVVVEGPSDEVVLRHLLGPGEEGDRLEFRVAGGWSAADSLARSLLASGRGDVAVVVDADSVDPKRVEERKRFLTRSLEAIESRARWQVVVIEPELEALFFTDRDILESLVGHPVSDADFVGGYFEPRKTLQKLLKGDRESVYREKLPTLDLQKIRELPAIRELRDFLHRVARRAAA